MKVILYSQSHFLNLYDSLKALGNVHKFKFADFMDQINYEVKHKTEFGNKVMQRIMDKKEFLTSEIFYGLWTIILKDNTDVEYLFIKIEDSKLATKSLLKVITDLKVELLFVVNFFLSKEQIRSKAKEFLKTYQSDEPISEEKGMELILEREADRMMILSDLNPSTEVVKIDANQQVEAIENKMIKELKIG